MSPTFSLFTTEEVHMANLHRKSRPNVSWKIKSMLTSHCAHIGNSGGYFTLLTFFPLCDRIRVARYNLFRKKAHVNPTLQHGNALFVRTMLHRKLQVIYPILGCPVVLKYWICNKTKNISYFPSKVLHIMWSTNWNAVNQPCMFVHQGNVKKNMFTVLQCESNKIYWHLRCPGTSEKTA